MSVLQDVFAEVLQELLNEVQSKLAGGELRRQVAGPYRVGCNMFATAPSPSDSLASPYVERFFEVLAKIEAFEAHREPTSAGADAMLDGVCRLTRDEVEGEFEWRLAVELDLQSPSGETLCRHEHQRVLAPPG